ncbi:MAG: penicillin-binding transpeptidase domain-containing protein [Chloroflexota bacterium]
MRKIIYSASTLLLLAIGLSACGNELAIPVIQDSREVVTLTPLATAIIPTATPVPGGAAEVANTYYKAWERGDLIGMYSLLSPQSQDLVGSDTFARAYEEAQNTASVQNITTRPVGVLQDGNRSTVEIEVIWQTAVVGNIVRNHLVELVFADGRWGIVWHEGLVMPDLAGGNKLSFQYRAPSRAAIRDINGVSLAYQGQAITLGVVPGEITDEAGMLATLSPLLNQTPEEIKEVYAAAKPDWYVPLGDVSKAAIEPVYDTLRPYFESGLRAEERLTRFYENVAPHIVGYTGAIPEWAFENYLAEGYSPDARVGLTGIESWGEPYLSGTLGGTLRVVAPDGSPVNTIAEVEPKQARPVYATIDIEYQRAVEQALAEAIFTHPAALRGSVVVMDVNTGEIKALANFPTYDPSVFDSSRPDNAQRLQAVLNDPGRPLVNRAAGGEYPPGSIFKLVTFGAAVNSGLYQPTTLYNSIGTWDRLGENFIKYDWIHAYTGRGHGNISLRHALVVSCNTCFYDAGYEMDVVDPFYFPNVAREFGLDQSTGIIGIADTAGNIPDPEWKPANTAEGGWVPGDAVNMAIGQGYVSVTPLQMARMAAAVANGGTLVTPRLIHRIGEGGGAPEEILPIQQDGRIPYSDDSLAAVQQAMWQVANDRSGTALEIFGEFGMQVAGKTGTAQNPATLPHAWFIGYAPAAPFTGLDGVTIEEPEIAIAVIMENSGEGSEVAAPVFRRMVELYFSMYTTNYPWQ